MTTTTKVQKNGRKTDVVFIECIEELEPYLEDIIERFNANKKQAFVAVADPIGVLEEFGYKLSQKASNKLLRYLPRPSRQAKDHYLAWLRSLEKLPDTFDLKLFPRKSGLELLEGTRGARPVSYERDAKEGKKVHGFDVVSQFSLDFCDRLLKRCYATYRMPHSVYRVNGKLHYFTDSGAYHDSKKYLAKSDREIHFGVPSLQFSKNKQHSVEVTSIFEASGFDTAKIKGTATVEGKLSLKKDSQGYPSYIEVVFDKLTTKGVTVSTPSPPGELISTIRDIYKNFQKDSLLLTTPHVPITFTFVEGGLLPTSGALNKISTEFSVKQPLGSTTPILMVGFNRAGGSTSGKFDSIPNRIKSGGDFVQIQDAGWLLEGLNASQARAFPLRYDANSGQIDKNGDLRIDSVTWRYRKGGLTGSVIGVYEEAFLFFSAELTAETLLDIDFNASVSTFVLTGRVGTGKVDFSVGDVCLMVLMGAVAAMIGGVIGGLVAGAVLGLGVEAVIAAAVLGGAVGLGMGLAGALVILGYEFKFDSSGGPVAQSMATKQSFKATHQQILPENLGNVKVVPNDFSISELGTFMCAKAIGPDQIEEQPRVVVAGTYAVDIDVTTSAATSRKNTKGSATDFSEVEVVYPKYKIDVDSGKIQKSVGTIALEYWVVKTSGLQGSLEYCWCFVSRGVDTVVSTTSTVNHEVQIPQGVLAELEHNEINHLGVLKLKVKDTFGRIATVKVSLTIGSKKDLRPLRHPQDDIWRDELEDLLKELGWGGPPMPDFGNRIGWRQADGQTILPEGRLVACKSFTSPLSGKKLIIVGAQTELI